MCVCVCVCAYRPVTFKGSSSAIRSQDSLLLGVSLGRFGAPFTRAKSIETRRQNAPVKEYVRPRRPTPTKVPFCKIRHILSPGEFSYNSTVCSPTLQYGQTQILWFHASANPFVSVSTGANSAYSKLRRKPNSAGLLSSHFVLTERVLLSLDSRGIHEMSYSTSPCCLIPMFRQPSIWRVNGPGSHE